MRAFLMYIKGTHPTIISSKLQKSRILRLLILVRWMNLIGGRVESDDREDRLIDSFQLLVTQNRIENSLLATGPPG